MCLVSRFYGLQAFRALYIMSFVVLYHVRTVLLVCEEGKKL